MKDYIIPSRRSIAKYFDPKYFGMIRFIHNVPVGCLMRPAEAGYDLGPIILKTGDTTGIMYYRKKKNGWIKKKPCDIDPSALVENLTHTF